MSYSTHSIEDHGLDAEGVEALEAAHLSTMSSVEHAMKANQEVSFWFLKGAACVRACRDPALKRSSLHVYAVLMQHMSAAHQWGWPSYATIQRETGLSEDGVQRAIKQLRDQGYIFTTKKAPPQGGRALVHYGLGSVVDMISEFLDGYRKLTPMEMSGSAPLTPLKMSGTIGDIIAAHSAQNAGVREPDPDQNAGVSLQTQAHPDNFVASIDIIGGPISKRDGVLHIATEVDPPFKKEDLFSDTEASNDPCCGIEFPALLREAIDAGTAPAAVRNFIDAVKRARRRKVEPTQIEMVCSKAVTKVCEETGEREPSPSALLGKATRYLLHTEAEAKITVPRVPLPNDGQGAWEYPIGRAKWISGLKRHVEVETLNGWIADANTRHGSRVARMRDCEAVIAEITCDDEIVSMILWAAIKRVYGYDGGAVPVDLRVIDDVLSKHPNVPGYFAQAHVENCYADPAAVGMSPSKYNGPEWLSNLRSATIDAFDRVLADAGRQRAEILVQDGSSMAQAFSCSELKPLNLDVLPVCKAEWMKAFEKNADQQNPFADHSGWSATAVAGVKACLLEMLEELLSRGPVNPTRSWSVSSHRNNCEKAIAYVRSVNWMPIPRRLNAVPPKLLCA